jgi:capsular polysaccharide biosynthesis protein
MSAAEQSRPPRVALGPALRRRGWLVLVSMVAVGAIAYGVASLQAATYSAESVLSVSPALGPSGPGSASQAAELAITYASAVPEDERLESLLDERIGSGGSIDARAEDDTSVLRVDYTTASESEAVEGAGLIADALSAEAPTSSSVAPGSLDVVRKPTDADPVGGEWRATAVMLVPSGAGQASAVNADQANTLAASYAGAIPADDKVLEATAEAVGASRAEVEANLSIVNPSDTSLLQVTFKSDTPRGADKGATAVAKLVSSEQPEASTVLPSSLDVVSLPETAGQTSSNAVLFIPIGVLLGLALGLVLVFTWERSDPHVRDPRDLTAQIGCPASPVDRLSPDAAAALLERWAGLTERVPAHIAVLPANGKAEAATGEAIKLLLDSGGSAVGYEDGRAAGRGGDGARPAADALSDVVLVQAAPPGTGSAAEVVALGCDLTVVVATKGMRATEVRALAEELGNFGIVPAWALLAPRRWSVARTRTDVDAVAARA